MEYQKEDSNSRRYSNLASALYESLNVCATKSIAGKIKTSLVCQYKGYYDKIKFYNTLMLEKETNTREKRLNNKSKKWKVKGSFEIMHGIRENFTQLKI